MRSSNPAANIANRAVSGAVAALSFWGALSTAVIAGEEPCAGRPSATRLLVLADHIGKNVGEVVVSVYPDDKRKFLVPGGDVATARRESRAPVTTVCVWLPAPGTYAVAVYQDVNLDGKLNRNLMGMPTEPYGFSNYPLSARGLPGFEAARLTVHIGDNTQHVEMRGRTP